MSCFHTIGPVMSVYRQAVELRRMLKSFSDVLRDVGVRTKNGKRPPYRHTESAGIVVLFPDKIYIFSNKA